MDNIQELQRQIRKYPHRPDLHSTLGRLYQQRGDRTEAAKHFLAAARLFADPSSPARNLNKAVAALKKMLRDFPENHDSYYLLADIYTEMENKNAAMDVFRSLSEVYQKEGKLLMAVSVHDKITGSYPDDIGAWLKFAELNQQAGMPFHAAQALVRAARLSMKAGRPREASSLTTAALKLDAENMDARHFLKDLLRNGHDGDVDTGDLMDLASDLERMGQTRQALMILSLLENGSLSSQAAAVADGIRKRAGVEKVQGASYTAERPPQTKYAGMRVLIVDDEREILLLLEQILKGEGFTVLTARDGERALEIFQNERPAIVVTDAMLPKIHGFELCRRIKEEAGSTIRVMILTAVYKKYKYKTRVQEEFHVDEYLDKPFQIAEFLDAFYRMIVDLPESSPEVPRVEEEHLASAEGMSILVVAGEERDLINRVSHFCDRNGCFFEVGLNAREMIEQIERDVPDIILLADSMPGMDPFIAAWLTTKVLGVRSSTLILITRDRTLLEGDSGEFHHRVAAPIGPETMDTLVRLHRRARERSAIGPAEKGMTAAERRMEAVLRSKVDHVLKSQYHLETYYTKRIKELEEELETLKNRARETIPGGS
ncbi:MAG: response regulator [bacterium]|nr:MAG: response regulator [bacterium]